MKQLIYFVQHGVALSKDVDEARPLSDVGINETRQIASKLKDKNILISKIFHSGKLRALQTAALFSEILTVETTTELRGMAPNDDPSALIAQLTEDNAMYIGHLPHIQKLVSKLITNSDNNDVIGYTNSAVACIEINSDVTHLKWFVTPSLC